MDFHASVQASQGKPHSSSDSKFEEQLKKETINPNSVKSLRTSKKQAKTLLLRLIKDGKRSLRATYSLSKPKLHVRKVTFMFGKTFQCAKGQFTRSDL